MFLGKKHPIPSPGVFQPVFIDVNERRKQKMKNNSGMHFGSCLTVVINPRKAKNEKNEKKSYSIKGNESWSINAQKKVSKENFFLLIGSRKEIWDEVFLGRFQFYLVFVLLPNWINFTSFGRLWFRDTKKFREFG